VHLTAWEFGVGEEAFDAGCLQPLEAIFSPEVLAEIARNCIGPPSVATALQASIGLCLSMRRRKSRQIGRILLSCSAPVTWDGAVTLSRSSGGLETAMSCDIRVASESAQFAAPEIKLGWIGGGGMAAHLTHSMGASNAALMALTGDLVSAKRGSHGGW
jgi:hypothetical protein